MSDINRIKNIMWAASKLAFSIVDGKLPTAYKTKIDYIYKDLQDNCYQRAEFTGDVYSCSEGVEEIHAGLVGISRIGIIIALRGTDGNDTQIGNFIDWLNNFLAIQVPFAPYGQGNVHLGFLNAVLSIKDFIIEKTKELIQYIENEGRKPTIYITGHSKGGAMAPLMAKMLKQQINNKIIVVSFGAPRSGDYIFRQSYEIPHIRYESFLDIIPHLYFTEQELELIPRLGPLYQILSPLLVFPAYAPIGLGACIYKPRGKIGLLPWETDNALGEKLNSFCGVNQVVISGKFDIFVEAHSDDYY